MPASAKSTCRRRRADGKLPVTGARAVPRGAGRDERLIRQINAGAYAFDAALLRDALAKLSTDNDQGEEYLTDVLGLLVAAGHRVATHRTDDPDEALGVNDRVQLAQLRALLRG